MSSTKQVRRTAALRVFLSHSPGDRVLARRLRSILSERLPIRVFTTEDLSAGEDWQTRLRDELAASDLVVALLTPESTRSTWVLHEVGAAWALRKPIVPLVTHHHVLNDIPVSLEGMQALELKDLEDPSFIDLLVRHIEQAMARLPLTTA